MDAKLCFAASCPAQVSGGAAELGTQRQQFLNDLRITLAERRGEVVLCKIPAVLAAHRLPRLEMQLRRIAHPISPPFLLLKTLKDSKSVLSCLARCPRYGREESHLFLLAS